MSSSSPSKVTLLELSFAPPPRADRHLDGGQTPVLAVIVALVITAADSCSDQSLPFVERGENPKDDGDAGVELDTHEAVRDGIRDVFEVHCFAFDQNADCDHRIEGLGRHRRDHRGRGIGRGRGGGGGSGSGGTRRKRRTKGEPAEKICRRRARLDSRTCYHPVQRKVQALSGFRSR